METFIILITNRFDSYDRYFVRRKTLEEAKKVASQYEYTKFQVDIFKGEDVD